MYNIKNVGGNNNVNIPVDGSVTMEGKQNEKITREIFGMLSDKKYYNDIINFILTTFKQIFGNDIILTEKCVDIEHFGHFCIYFKYIPLKYKIIFENEMNLFDIVIYDKYGARNSLHRICEHDGHLSKENIKNATLKLYNILADNNFNFYVHQNDKLYLKKGSEYKRIKHIHELLKIIEKEREYNKKRLKN